MESWDICKLTSFREIKIKLVAAEFVGGYIAD